ncbi:MAG: hypothetical protein WD749_06700 [Phycisphaerales bacterium]
MHAERTTTRPSGTGVPPVPIALIALLLGVPAALAQSPRELISQGNTHFAARELDEAAELYRRAQSAKDRPAPAAAIYNEGCVFLEQGKTEGAIDRFRAADAAAGSDADTAARARFNLGQALLRAGTEAREKQPEQAMPLLRQSAAAFRSVLEVATGDTDAARHVEIVRRLMKQFEDEQRQKQEHQQQQNQNQNQNQNQQGRGGGDGQNQDHQNQDQQPSEAQQQADALRDLAQRQREAAQQSAQAQQQGAGRDQLDQLRQQQDQLKQDTARAQEQQQKSGGEPDESLQQAQQEQQQAADQLAKGNPQAAREHQQRAAEHLEQAAQRAQERARQQQQSQQGQGQPQKDEQNQQGDSATRSSADASRERERNYDKTASALLDRERQLRKERQPAIRAPRGSAPPVEKDW